MIEVPPQHCPSLDELIKESRANPVGDLMDLHWAEDGIDIFLKAIDKYAAMAKREIVSRGQDHTDEMRDRLAEREDVEAKIKVEQANEAEMLRTIDQERQRVAELTGRLKTLKMSLAKAKEMEETARKDVDTVKMDVCVESEVKERRARVLGDNRAKDAAHVLALQDALGLSIQGVQKNRLLFTFTLIDAAHPDREFKFVIDTTNEAYTVPQCDPHLPAMPWLVDVLNSDGDLWAFIKKVRVAFVGLVH